jgi:hypothetical protein
MRLFYSNADVAALGLDEARKAWNGLNSGLVDVEDIEVLYQHLKALVKAHEARRAAEYDRQRSVV